MMVKKFIFPLLFASSFSAFGMNGGQEQLDSNSSLREVHHVLEMDEEPSSSPKCSKKKAILTAVGIGLGSGAVLAFLASTARGMAGIPLPTETIPFKPSGLTPRFYTPFDPSTCNLNTTVPFSALSRNDQLIVFLDLAPTACEHAKDFDRFLEKSFKKRYPGSDIPYEDLPFLVTTWLEDHVNRGREDHVSLNLKLGEEGDLISCDTTCREFLSAALTEPRPDIASPDIEISRFHVYINFLRKDLRQELKEDKRSTKVLTALFSQEQTTSAQTLPDLTSGTSWVGSFKNATRAALTSAKEAFVKLNTLGVYDFSSTSLPISPKKK